MYVESSSELSNTLLTASKGNTEIGRIYVSDIATVYILTCNGRFFSNNQYSLLCSDRVIEDLGKAQFYLTSMCSATLCAACGQNQAAGHSRYYLYNNYKVFIGRDVLGVGSAC